MKEALPLFLQEKLKKQFSHLLTEAPLLGAFPPFDWNQAGTLLSQAWQLGSVALAPKRIEQHKIEQIKKRVGSDFACFAFFLGSYKSPVFLLMPKESWMLLVYAGGFAAQFTESEKEQHTEENRTQKYLVTDDDFFPGFSHYFLLQALIACNRANLFWNETLYFSPEEPPPDKGNFLCQEIAFKIEEKQPSTGAPPGTVSSFALVAYPENLVHELRKSQAPSPTSFLEKAKHLTLPIAVCLEVGSVLLSSQELKQVKTGDLILLDRCSYHPEKEASFAVAKCGTSSLFHVKIKDNKYKIVDYALYDEDSMKKLPPDDFEEDAADFEDDDEPSEEESDDFFDDEEEDAETEEADEKSSKEDSGESFDENDFDYDDIDTQDAHPLSSSKKHSENDLTTPINTETTPLVLAKDVPLLLSVELGRVELTLQKILELTPGNVLHLATHPSRTVDLMLNGNKLAEGELVEIGDAVGVRILTPIQT